MNLLGALTHLIIASLLFEIPAFALRGTAVDDINHETVRIIARGGSVRDIGCSAVRISKSYVLTAAHCIILMGGIDDIKTNYVIQYSVSDFDNMNGVPESTLLFYPEDEELPKRDFINIERNIERIFVHPSIQTNYPGAVSGDQSWLSALKDKKQLRGKIMAEELVDLALIQMGPYKAEPLKRERGNIAVMATKREMQALLRNSPLTAFGYGRASASPLGFILDGHLREGLFDFNGYFMDNEFRVENEGRAEKIMPGDSGGPIFSQTENFQRLLLGVVSGAVESSLSRWIQWTNGAVGYAPAYRICDFDLKSSGELRPIIERVCH